LASWRGSEVKGGKGRAGRPKLPVRHQVSAGGILYRRGENGFEIALIGLKGGTVWALPKGLVESDENPEQTALREVQEETGLTGRSVGKVGEIEYWFVDREEGSRVHKRVHFYLLEHTGGDLGHHDSEVEEVRWVPLAEALIHLTYKSEGEMVEKAAKLLIPPR
jgi:8-oxo-dGTP pyrophosphatase MutT (NUDIX family)